MTKLAYTEAAARLSSLVQDTREVEAAPQHVKPAAKKMQIDLALSRPAWVRGSVAEAVRREPVNDGWRGSDQACGGQFCGGWGDRGRRESRGGHAGRSVFVIGQGGGDGNYRRGCGGPACGVYVKGGHDGRVSRGGRGGLCGCGY